MNTEYYVLIHGYELTTNHELCSLPYTIYHEPYIYSHYIFVYSHASEKTGYVNSNPKQVSDGVITN
jgi:hypothetical protein